MDSPLPMPSNLGQIEPPKDYFFDNRIPRLGDLLPQFHGQPGYVYAQVCMTNGRRAQDEGWAEVANTAIYTIRGPNGEVHCKLYAMGRGIPGQSHASGRRVCMVDDEVEVATGLEIQPGLKVKVEAGGGEPALESVDAEIKVEQEPKNEVKTSGKVSAKQRKSFDLESEDQT